MLNGVKALAINVIVSAGSWGVGFFCLDFQRHNSLNPSRCHGRIVSGFTRSTASRHRGRSRARRIPGYYAVLFEDPDGIRLEVNHVPGRGLLEPGVERPTGI
jgi:hypothetical protein